MTIKIRFVQEAHVTEHHQHEPAKVATNLMEKNLEFNEITDYDVDYIHNLGVSNSVAFDTRHRGCWRPRRCGRKHDTCWEDNENYDNSDYDYSIYDYSMTKSIIRSFENWVHRHNELDVQYGIVPDSEQTPRDEIDCWCLIFDESDGGSGLGGGRFAAAKGSGFGGGSISDPSDPPRWAPKTDAPGDPGVAYHHVKQEVGHCLDLCGGGWTECWENTYPEDGPCLDDGNNDGGLKESHGCGQSYSKYDIDNNTVRAPREDLSLHGNFPGNQDSDWAETPMEDDHYDDLDGDEEYDDGSIGAADDTQNHCGVKNLFGADDIPVTEAGSYPEDPDEDDTDYKEYEDGFYRYDCAGCFLRKRYKK